MDRRRRSPGETGRPRVARRALPRWGAALTWARATSGVPATCQSCGKREILLGHADLGRDPQGLAVFREGARGRTVLTFRCSECGILNTVDIGEPAHSPP